MLTENPLSQDALLIPRCRQGDNEAIALLIARHKRPVYLLALRWTGNADDAEDITQETFMRALAHLDGIDPLRGIRFWLLTIAANLCRNHKRARWRRWQALLNFFEHRVNQKRRGDPLLRDQLQRGLNALAPDIRAAVVLVWIQGLTHGEAGEVLGIAEGTVSWRIFKAKEAMRKWLADDWPSRPGRKDGACKP